MFWTFSVFLPRAVAWSSRLVVVITLGLGLPGASGAQPPAPTSAADGLFLPLGGGLSGEIQGAFAGEVPGGAPAPSPAGVIRSRRVAIDFTLLGERVEGLLDRPAVDPGRDDVPRLVLNFFDDASVEMSVEAVEPAALGDGYVVSGSVSGQPGSIVLVVHADSNDRVVAVSGSATTAEGAFRIATVGGGTYSIEEIDTTIPWVDGVVPDEPALRDPAPTPGASDAALSRVDPAVSAAASGVSEIDVLVLYTPAAAAQAGGEASMRAQVELLFGETNEAFRNSGVSARVGGWARAVSYAESGDTGIDLERLSDPFDGWLDDVHALRADVGADLVHLLVAFDPAASSDGSYTCGVAWLDQRSDFGFGVTLLYPVCRYTFTHELGHNLGLKHDRYQNFTHGNARPAHVPYAYGYSNADTFSPVGGGQCWYTVMAYYKHCSDVPGGAGFATKVLRFSSPYGRHPWSGEPLGVLGEVETYSAYGPADAARALEHTRARVASYYHRPDPPTVTGVDLTVSPGSVSVSPVVVDVGEAVHVQASVANTGAGFVSSSTVSFWSRYDDSDAEWVQHATRTPGGLAAGSSKTVTWRGTGGSEPGAEYWGVCVAVGGDVDPDNDCALAGETVVIRDPDAVDGGELVAESSGELEVGAIGEVEFTVSNITGEEFQIQPHWFLFGYEPVEQDIGGAIQNWYCYEEVPSDCWNTDGTENADAEWDWRTRAWGFGADGTFLMLLGVEAYSWSDGDKWRFTFGEATSADEDPDAEITWRFGVLRVTEDLANGGGGGSGEALDRVRGAGGGVLPAGGGALQLPRAIRDAFRPAPSTLAPPMLRRER